MSDHAFEASSHPIPRKMPQLLAERPRLYSELMEGVEVDSPTPALHLKKPAGPVEKNEKGLYQLTEAGERAARTIKEVGDKASRAGALDGGGPPPPRQAPPKIDNAPLEIAKREGRRIGIQDAATVETEKDVDPKLHEVERRLETRQLRRRRRS